MLKLIAAVDESWGIGKDNGLLTHLPEDLAFFMQKTMGHPIVMGRKTFESLPNGALPGRENIVLTRDENFTAPNIKTIHALVEAPNDAFIIGGAEVYNQFLKRCNLAYITKIHRTFNADVFIPNLDALPEWQIIEKSQIKKHNDIEFQFYTYERNPL